MGEERKAGRGTLAWSLVFLVYLFLVANSLFSGMFAELEDRAAYSYRPASTLELVEQIIALVVTLGPLAWGTLRWRALLRARGDLSEEERLIAQLLVALVIAAALRSGLTLALRLDTASAALEWAILALQITASLVLVGGGLRLVLQSRAAQHGER